ncbi:MAG: acyl CoA:acetate/3-ketoacid CoA transferase [Rhodospirillales bacterium]|nr:acyl CoA:acetate/3-ketoacid CoA transferase [Rhodospirillales bacterium]
MKSVISAAEAAGLLRDGDSMIVGGSAGMGIAESVMVALEKRFLDGGMPRDLTIIHTTGIGAVTGQGLNRLAHKGLVKRVIGGNYGLQLPFMKTLIVTNEIEAYNLPQGVLCQLYRATAAKQPGVVTHVGLHTYIDPRQEGGKMNAKTTEDLVEVVTLGGREWLFYKALQANVALIRGTTADEDGNVSLEHEATTLEGMSMAQAVHNAGGTVICQVKRLAKRGSLHPQMVRIPGFLIDHFVVDPDQKQNYAVTYDPSRSGEISQPFASIKPEPLSERRVIARRAAFELSPGAVINMGVGVSAAIPNVVAEEEIEDLFTLTVEAGVIGGIAGQGLHFGTAINPRAIIDQPYQFDFYDGGGLDVAFVSFAEIDAEGNVNVTRFGDRNDGAGGFIDITQNAKRIVFSGTLTGGGLKVGIAGGKILIDTDGTVRKFVPRVNQISYNGRVGRERGQAAMVVTERAVFRFGPRGVELVEIAPGMRVKEDILDRMGFTPAVASDLKTMDTRLYREGPMGLRADILARGNARR